MALLPVGEAHHRLLDGAEPLPMEWVDLDQAAERVLAESLIARRTQPPFDASAMDGYAVQAEDTTDPKRNLRVIGEAVAGRRFGGRVGAGEAVRIFTGAPVPEGADAVLIQENVDRAGDLIVALEPVAEGRNIRRAGLDFAEGQSLLPKGRRLDPGALSLAAAANLSVLPVVRRPRVALIATGNELVLPGTEPGPDQIIASNSFGVAAVARGVGAEVIDLGVVPDDKQAIGDAIARAKAQADVIVTLGGASVGDHDLVRPVLEQAGIDLSFWKIAMRPGKPLMFGRLGTTRVLGLPGNPVASLVCSHLFLAPLLARLGGLEYVADIRDARLGLAMAENGEREDYVRATTKLVDGALVATPLPVQDSSMLSTLAQSDALIIRPPFAPPAQAGSSCRVFKLR